MNSLSGDRLVSTLIIRKVIDGGMIGPTTLAAAVSAAENPRPYPALIIEGISTLPSAEVSAIAEPEMPAISVAAAAFTGGTSPAIVIGQSAPVDTKLRAVGGDWSQCAYGVGMDIMVKVSDTASYVDEAGVTHSAFQENLVLLLVEAYYGFVVGDRNAFVVYTDAS